MLRPASWLALLSRTFTFELSLAGSPRANVEYDYVGKQSIPTTGLSPASPTALWAAEQALRRMAIRQARLEPLALSASGHERMVIGPTAASKEQRIDFSAGIAWFGA